MQSKCQNSSVRLRKKPFSINEPCLKICHCAAYFSEKHHPAKLLLNANPVTARIIQCSDLPSSHFGIGCSTQGRCINSRREHRLKRGSINKLPVMDMQMKQERILKQPYLFFAATLSCPKFIEILILLARLAMDYVVTLAYVVTFLRRLIIISC